MDSTVFGYLYYMQRIFLDLNVIDNWLFSYIFLFYNFI